MFLCCVWRAFRISTLINNRMLSDWYYYDCLSYCFESPQKMSTANLSVLWLQFPTVFKSKCELWVRFGRFVFLFLSVSWKTWFLNVGRVGDWITSYLYISNNESFLSVCMSVCLSICLLLNQIHMVAPILVFHSNAFWMKLVVV